MIKNHPRFGIVDYGSGNIAALEQAIKCISSESIILENKFDIKNKSFSHLILLALEDLIQVWIYCIKRISRINN